MKIDRLIIPGSHSALGEKTTSFAGGESGATGDGERPHEGRDSDDLNGSVAKDEAKQAEGGNDGDVPPELFQVLAGGNGGESESVNLVRLRPHSLV